MSDNAIRPPSWLNNGQRSLQEEPVVAPTLVDMGGGGGHGPIDPGVAPRVVALEADMKDVKASLKGLELSSTRIETVLGTIATKVDVAALVGTIGSLTERLHAHSERLSGVEKSVADTINTALSKSLGAGSIVAMVAGIGAVAVGLVTAVA